MAHIIKNVDQLQCILNHQHTRILFPIKNSDHKSTALTSTLHYQSAINSALQS